MSFIMLFLSGCWDYTEIERRGYVLGIAIDPANPVPKGQETEEDYLNERDLEEIELLAGKKKYAYTIQIPIIPMALVKPAGGGNGGDASQEKTWDLTVVGESFFEANRLFSTRLNYPPFYAHLKVIVINEEIARKDMFETLDVMLRDPEMRRRTRVFITPGEAKKVLDVKPNIDDYASLYLEKLPQNAFKTSRMPHKTDLGEVSSNIQANIDFALPKIIASKDEIKNAGVAVFRQGKMVGWLGELDTFYAKWVRDNVIGGFFVIDSPYKEGKIITLEIDSSSVKVRPIVKNGTITMSIKGKTTMSVAESSAISGPEPFNDKVLGQLEEIASKKIEKGIEDTIRYVQKEFNADIFHFSLALQRYEPSTWDKIKDNWYDIFKNMEADIEIDVKIHDTGLTM